jgi:plastocyanin domain-containing protein
MPKHSVISRAALSLTVTAAVVGVLPEQEAAAASVEPAPAVREIEVVVDGGYRPGRITVTEGERVRLTFVRREHSPCTREVVFPGLDIRRELPTDQAVVIELPALAPGEYEFKCGMNMIKGVLEVRAREP